MLFGNDIIQLIRKKMMKTAKEGIKQQASHSEIYGKMHAVFVEMDPAPTVSTLIYTHTYICIHTTYIKFVEQDSFLQNTVDHELKDLKEAVMNHEDEGPTSNADFDPEKYIDAHLPVRVTEQRVSNLLQSILVGVAVCAMPLIKMIPTSVLWGYFAYMAIDSLPGSQFWERILLLLVPPRRRFKVLQGAHASFVEYVPFKYIAAFTILQFVYLLICFGVTWIPIAGILFPLPFFILISLREHVLPKFFPANYLQDLDAAEYEEIIGHSGQRRNLPPYEVRKKKKNKSFTD